MFANAQVLNTPKTSKGKSKKKEVKLAGLENYALLDALIKNLESVKSSFQDQIKDEAREYFVESATGKKPENFRGIDGSAEASVELRKRSSRSALNDAEIKTLEAQNLPVGVVEEVTETFVINPTYARDSKLLGKIEKALKKVPGLPADFILQQKGQNRTIVTDDTIDAVFADGELAEQFIDTVCLIALKPKLENPNLKTALDLAKKFVK